MTHSRTSLVDLLNQHSLKPSRALGQNFVVDPNTVRRIARLAGVGPDDFVLEIGPGLGSLTLALVETGAQVEAIEIDRYLLEPLRSVVEPHGVTVHHADALTADYDAILQGREAVVVANLPYNVATPLVLHLLETVPLITRMLVMVQKEVGERFAAQAGDEAYGAVSLRVQYFADATVVGIIGERYDQPDCAKGAVFDGFPRTIPQAQALDAMLAERGRQIDLVLELKVDDAVLLSRVEARIKAGGVLRSDDTPETLAHRLGVYY